MTDSNPGPSAADGSARASRPLEPFLLGALFVGLVVFVVGGVLWRDWRAPVASAHGEQIDGLIDYLLITSGAIFVIGHVVLIGFLIRYGRTPTTESPTTTRRMERLWSILPVLLLAAISEAGVLVMALPVWSEIHADPPADALPLRVYAKQFEWIVQYPGADGEFGVFDATITDPANPARIADRMVAGAPGTDDLVLINEIHVPVGQPIYIELRAWDVLHSFSVPAFRVKQDTVPGLTTQTLFTPTRIGTYEIACAELCGMSHYDMRGRIIVHAADEYAEWLVERAAFEFGE